MVKPLISVIIAAYNEEKKIGKCLNSLLKQSYKNIEIIVVDDGSSDKTREIIKEFIKKNKKISLLKQHRQGPGKAKNLASKKAKGSIIVFVDADEYPKKDYIEKLISPLIKKEAEISIGAWHIANPKSVWARSRFKDSAKIRQHALKSGVFRAITKKLFIKSGGFDSSKGYSDDRLGTGKKRARVNDAIFYHDIDSSLGELYNKRKWIGSSIAGNPKSFRFWGKLILGLIFFLGFINFLFFYPIISLIIFILVIIPLLFKSIIKAFFYKDIRLLFAYPTYSIVCLIGMTIGFIFPEYKK